MSINSDEFFNLKKRYEEAKDNLKYSSDDMVLYYIEQLEEVTDEILKCLAAYLLNDDEYFKEYFEEDEDDEERYVVKGRS